MVDIPIDVMLAISLTETGRRTSGALRPWPWTVNMEGNGAWFDTRAEALDYVVDHHRRGARSFDVGCFQLNYKWHGRHFRSIEAMFDPTENALYAARFLRSLFKEKGNWPDAAAAYHSRTPKYAQKYRSRFQRILEDLRTAPAIHTATPAREVMPKRAGQEPVNDFPLLTGSGSGSTSHGSLFPPHPAGNRVRLIGG